MDRRLKTVNYDLIKPPFMGKWITNSENVVRQCDRKSLNIIFLTCIWWDDLPGLAVLTRWSYGMQTVASCVAAPCRQTSWRAVNSSTELRGGRKHTSNHLLQLFINHLLLVSTNFSCQVFCSFKALLRPKRKLYHSDYNIENGHSQKISKVT